MSPNDGRPSNLFELYVWLGARAGRMDSFMSDDTVGDEVKEFVTNYFVVCATDRTRIVDSTNEKEILIRAISMGGRLERFDFTPSTSPAPHVKISNCGPYLGRIFQMASDKKGQLENNDVRLAGERNNRAELVGGICTGCLAYASIKAFHEALPDYQRARYNENLFFDGMPFETNNMETAYVLIDALLLASTRFNETGDIPSEFVM